MKNTFVCQTQAIADRVSDEKFASVTTFNKFNPADYKRANVVIVSERNGKSNVTKILKDLKKACANEVRIVSLKDKPEDFLLMEQEDVDFRKTLTETIIGDAAYVGRKSLMRYGIGRFAGPAKVQGWLVGSPREGQGIVPDDKPILLAGRGGIGKTTSAIELAIKIGCLDSIEPLNQRWMGQKITGSGVSIILTWEEDTESMHRKVKAIAQANGIDPALCDERVIVKSYQDVDVSPDPLVFFDSKTKTPKPTEEYIALTEELREVEKYYGRIGTVVIDNVGTAFGVEGNSYQEANGAMKWIQRWSSEFHCATVVVAHTNKGALNKTTSKEGPQVQSDDDVLASVMGSTGWTSAVRAVLVMWQMTEEQEARLASAMDDADFVPGESRRKYIHAQVLKENCEAYTGRFTLCRGEGLTLQDISNEKSRAFAAKKNELHERFKKSIVDALVSGFAFQKSGKNGVFENKDKLRGFEKYSKSQLHGICDECIANGLIAHTPDHPTGGSSTKNASWLIAA
tara:strand:+ start:5886 stop:7424 length:1539 start_codon:yes stop_codon:yes gene_type:complete